MAVKYLHCILKSGSDPFKVIMQYGDMVMCRMQDNTLYSFNVVMLDFFWL